MTPNELKTNIHKYNPDSHFFDRKTMQFFGDTMRNYGIRKAKIGGVPVWELYRKKPVKHCLKRSAFFRATDFKRVFERS